MTPADASAPYRVAAAGPLTISMLSMSSGLRSFKTLGACPDVALPLPLTLKSARNPPSMRTPSTNTSGWLESEMEAAPRMRSRVALPVVPDPSVSVTPGTRASSSCVTLVIGAWRVSVDASTLATTAACARRSWLPAVPVTTTCSSETACDVSVTSTVTRPGERVKRTVAGR